MCTYVLHLNQTSNERKIMNFHYHNVVFGNSLKPFQQNSCKLYFLFIFQETIIANGGDTEVDVFGNVLVDGREFDLSTSVSNSGHYKYISLISAAVALFFLSLCVAAFVTWRR